MMRVLLVVLSVLFGAQSAWRPVAVERSIKRANRATAKETVSWKKFDPKSAEYQTAIETIKRSGVFDSPVEVPVRILSYKVDSQTGARKPKCML